MTTQPPNSFRSVDPVTGVVTEILLTEEQARQLAQDGSTAGWVQDDQAQTLIDEDGRITQRESWRPPESPADS